MKDHDKCMENLTESLTTGYHGTEGKHVDEILKNGFKLGSPEGWLGSAIYFWEHNKNLALHWCVRQKISDPAVVAAEIDLRPDCCLDLTDAEGIKSYNQFVKTICAKPRYREQLDEWLQTTRSEFSDTFFIQLFFEMGPILAVRFNAMADDAAIEKPERHYRYPGLPAERYRSRFVINVRRILALKDNSLIRRKYRCSNVSQEAS